MKRCLGLFLAVLLLLFSSDVHAIEKIKIALLAGFTGVASIPSFHLLNTVKMEADLINKMGGVDGKEIELIILDDESNPVKTRQIASSPALDNVAAVIGFPWSQFILVAGDILQERKIPSISILATHNNAVHMGDYIFRVCFTNDYQGRKLARYAWEVVGVRKPLILINRENSYSNDLAEAFIEEYSRRGGTIAGEVEYIPKYSIDELRRRIKMHDISSYDSVFIPDNQIYVMPVMEAFRSLDAADKIYFGGDGWNMAHLHIKNPALKPYKAYVVGHWDDGGGNPRSMDIIARYESLANTEAQDATALSYDAFHILINAIRRAKILDRHEIKNELYKTDFNGLSGRIRFDAKGDVMRKPIVIHEVHKSARRSHRY